MATEVAEPRNPEVAPVRRLLPKPAERNMMVKLANDLCGNGTKNCRIASQVFAKILIGYEHGIPPGVAINEIDLIDERWVVPPPVMIAAIRQAGTGDVSVANVTDDEATVIVTRADWPAGRTERVTYRCADAIMAGLLQLDAQGKNISRKDNWRKYPSQMLLARARGEAIRRYFEDCAAGLAYSADELGAVTDEDGHVIDGGNGHSEPDAELIQPPQSGATMALRPAKGSDVPSPSPAAPAPASPASDLSQPIGETVTPPPSALRLATPPAQPAAQPAPQPQIPTTPAGEPSPLIKKAGQLVADLKLTQEEWRSIVARLGGGATSLKAVAPADQELIVDFLADLDGIATYRNLGGITEPQWAAALKKRGVERTIDLRPEDARELCKKLGELVTPFDRQKVEARRGADARPAAQETSLAGKA